MRGGMDATSLRAVHSSWPIVYGHRRFRARDRRVGGAWALFLGLGVPFALMAVLTMLARMGIYVDLFRPLWLPWPPDPLKPFLGVAGFAATLAYLAYRLGHRSGFKAGARAEMASTRNRIEGRSESAPRDGDAEGGAVPPPPDDL